MTEEKAGRGGFLAILLALSAVCLFTPEKSQAKDTTIYFYRDSDTVFHFSNRRTSPKYKVYLVFRDIMNRFPNVDKKKIIQIANAYSRRYGLDERLVQAVIQIESGFRSEAVSTAGAEGLMQIMPATQKHLGVSNSFDPHQNIEGGVKYLKRMIDRFGDLDLALAAYNAGPGNVEKYRGIPPFRETQNYVRKVLALYNKLKAR